MVDRENAGKRADVGPPATPPVDYYGKIYLAMILAGTGFLFPYNSFVMAVDYFQHKYPNSMVVFDMTSVYVLVAFAAVLANNMFVDKLSFRWRINIGYGLTISMLLFVGAVEILWEELFTLETSYHLNLIAIAIIACGATIQQSSFYGFTSILPQKYTQAVMIGESVAGLWVSIDRIFTKTLTEDLRLSTFSFFVISHLVVITSCIVFQIVQSSEVVKFYMTKCKESRKRLSMDSSEESNDSAVQNQPEPLAETSLGSVRRIFEKPKPISLDNPLYDQNKFIFEIDAQTHRVEDVMVHIERGSILSARKSVLSEWWESFSFACVSRIHMSQFIRSEMLSIFLCYFVTLSVYPGVLSDLVSPRFGTWMPVLVMTVFNTFDLVGKLLGAYCSNEVWEILLPQIVMKRMLLVPAILLLVFLQHPFHIRIISEFLIFLLTALLGVSNGIAGSVPMTMAPAEIAQFRRELVGNLMTMSYIAGTTAGSLFAYVLDRMIHFDFPAGSTDRMPYQPHQTLQEDATARHAFNKSVFVVLDQLNRTTSAIPSAAARPSEYHLGTLLSQSSSSHIINSTTAATFPG